MRTSVDPRHWDPRSGKPTATVTAKKPEEAREDMEALREYIHDLPEDARQIQPADPHE